jgi:hypothetical protein
MWKHSLVISAVPGLFCCYLFFASTQCSRCRLYAIITLWLIADLHQQPLLTGDRAGTRRRSGGVVGLVHSAKHEVYTIIIDLQQCLSYATHSRNLLRSHEPDMSPPGPFPTAHSMPSYWRSNSNPIDSHRSSETLPSEADIVIVGAGYSDRPSSHRRERTAGSSAPINSDLGSTRGLLWSYWTEWYVRDSVHILLLVMERTHSSYQVAISSQIPTQGQRTSSGPMAKRSLSTWRLLRLAKSKRSRTLLNAKV